MPLRSWNEKMNRQEEFEGLTVKEINVCKDEIMLCCDNGCNYYFYHEQDCCENVYIVHTDGDPSCLKNMKLVEVEQTAKSFGEYQDGYTEEYILENHPEIDKGSIDYSNTLTELVFRTQEDTVCFKWLGTSNGYYSESVDLRKVTMVV